MTNACCHRTVSAVFAGSLALAPLVSPGAACFLDAVLASLPYLSARTGFSTSTRSAHSPPACVRSRDSSFHRPAPKLIALGKHHPPATFAIAPNSPTHLVARYRPAAILDYQPHPNDAPPMLYVSLGRATSSCGSAKSITVAAESNWKLTVWAVAFPSRQSIKSCTENR